MYMKRSVVWVSSNFWPLLPAFVGLLAIATLVLGCGAQTTQAPWPLVQEAHAKGRKATPKRPMNAATLVEASLRDRGLRFGTDGSVKALYSYATQTHERVNAQEARPGDVVFFDTSRAGNQCGGHVGLVQGFAPGGALKFRERRGGEERVSVADPQRPGQRRDEDGRVINTFIRPVKPDDPAGTRYYAGQMVCAVVRVTR